MLPHSNRITDYTSFQSAGFQNVDKIIFAKKNLIIGKNGSGKTRFLKTLEQYKINQDKKSVITLYFPEIQSFYSENPPKTPKTSPLEPGTEVYPYDLLLSNENYSFFDFLKIMENDNCNFLNNLLAVMRLQKTKQSIKAQNILDELNGLLYELLGKKIIYEEEDDKIFIVNVEVNTIVRQLPLTASLSEFSPGELMLFYLSVFITALKQKSGKHFVLILDEPELHLHPRALIKMIETLTNHESVCELWIATHSLFLVPLFSFEEIVFMHQNNVFGRSSQTYKELYDSLIGLENINIFEFLKSLDSWQYYQFIVECFCLPEPVGKANPNDEQFQKLLNCVKEKKTSEPLQMLDYGAGKCRIWECIQLLPNSDLIKKTLEYTAYEPYPQLSSRPSFQLHTEFESIIIDQRQFDVVVLMNVLHEINVELWESVFNNIYKVLAEDGVLIFLEVLSLTKGEQPYGNNGYLVLQDHQIKLLFNDNNIVNMRKDAKEKSNCWMITKNQVKNVTAQTIQKSIESLCTCSYNELKLEFHKKMNYAHQQTDTQSKQIAARNYAFLTQQYVNAKIALDQLNPTGLTQKKSSNQQTASQTIKVKGIKKIQT